MENFQYSIQLNDRDWAEFYSASEECSLLPAALATADEQGVSDTDQGDGEAGSPRAARLITVRAAPGTGHCPAHGVPAETTPSRPIPGRPARGEVASGSEDEMEPGSGGRCLWESDKPGSPQQTPLMPSAQEKQLSRVSGAGRGMEKPLQGQDSPCKEMGQAAGWTGGAPFAVQAGGGLAVVPRGYLPEGAAQEGELPGEQREGSPEKAECERPVLAVALSSPALAASGGVERPAGGQAHWSLCSEPGLPDPNGDISHNPSAEPLQPACCKIPGESRPAGRNPGGRLGLGQTLATRGSPGDSAGIVQPRGPVHPGESREHQGTPTAAATPSHGAVALQSSTPAMGLLTPSAPLREEGIVARPALGELEGEDEARRDGIGETMSLNQSSKPAASQREEERSSPGKPLQPGSTVAFGGDAEDGALGRPRSALAGGMFPHHSEDSQEGARPALTWPEMYEYFFCDAQEQGGELSSLGGGAQTPTSPREEEQEVPEMYGPEMYEYFFNEPEGRGGGGSSAGVAQTSVPCESREDPGSAPAGEPGGVIAIPEVSNRASGRRSWGRVFLSLPALEARKTVAALKSFLQKPMRLVRHRGILGPPGSIKRLPLLQQRPHGRIQLKPEDGGTPPALAERPHPPLALTQEDMCLVFVAFASWAVKTSDLQAPDAWKTVLLANVGTLSAIRYFRRQAIEGRHGT